MPILEVLDYLPIDLTDIMRAYNIEVPVTKKEKPIDYNMKLVQEKLVISVDLPGSTLDDVHVFTEDRYITVHALRDGTERKVSFRVNEEYDPDTTEVFLSNGVLKIGCDKRTTPNRREVKILQG